MLPVSTSNHNPFKESIILRNPLSPFLQSNQGYLVQPISLTSHLTPYVNILNGQSGEDEAYMYIFGPCK